MQETLKRSGGFTEALLHAKDAKVWFLAGD